MSATRSQSRAIRQINRDQSLQTEFQRQTTQMNPSQRNAHAIVFLDQNFQSQLAQLEARRLNAQRLARERRTQAQGQLIGNNPIQFPVAPEAPDELGRLIEFITEREEDIQNGAVFILRSGDTYYTLSQTNYQELLDALQNDNIEFDDAVDSHSAFALVLIGNRDFEVSQYIPQQMRRQMNPDRNTGSFLPFIHRIDDEHLKKMLHSMGLFSEVCEENYQMNCLVHSLKDNVSQEVVDDVKTAVRNSTVPRKHLRIIGQQYALLFVIHTDQDNHIRKYGDPNGREVELCLFRNHYFPYIKDTGITGFAIKHYDVIKKKYPNSWKLKKNMNGSSGKEGISSMRLMKLICDSDLVQPIDMSNPEIWKTVYVSKISGHFDSLDFPDDAIRLVHQPRGIQEDKEEFKKEIINLKKYRRKFLSRIDGGETVSRLDKQIKDKRLGYKEQEALFRSSMIPSYTIFFDFESSSEGLHKAYMVSWQISEEDEIYTRTGPNCAYEFLEWLNFTFGEESDDIELVLIAHNVSYDLSFLLEYLDVGSLKAIKKGNRFISAEGEFKDLTINFKDSYKLIPAALRTFPAMFDLPGEKEIMPYEIFTKDFIQGDFKIKPEQICNIYGQAYVDSMLPNITKWLCVTIRDGEIFWDMLKYAQNYCERDVQLLCQGWQKFRKMSLEFFDIDINAREILTTAGMSFRHLMNKCFDETYSISGIVLEFVRRSTVGGQTQSARNKPIMIEKDILDMDKRSLYPSAMVEMPGVPKGKPKVFKGIIPSEASYFFVEITIDRVRGPDYDFPILAVRNANGVNDWTNDIEGSSVIIGTQTLNDLIDWNDEFEYTVIHGYYWDEGFNTHISSTIEEMYNRRDELKRNGNPAQLIYKLLMNASYGRCGLKPIDDTDIYLIPSQVNRYLANNHDRIKRINIMPNGDTRVLTAKPINRHFNQQHVASMILEKAKHLMRKVLLIQQRVQSPLAGNIYYTDTDSIHISRDAWVELESIWSNLHGTQLEGKKLGQFHSDFEMGGTYQIKDQKLVPTYIDKSLLKEGNLFSKKLYVCGKKAYLDVLTSDKNRDEVELYHFRLKGISESAVIHKCNEEYSGDIQALYQDLITGNRAKFTLSGMFKTGLDGTIKTVSQDRTVQFTALGAILV